MTRPDISYAVAAHSRHCSNPSSDHWVAAKRLLRYLRGSSKLGIQYQHARNPENRKIAGYSDASFASDMESRKSHQGYLFLAAGGPIIWQSRLQRIVTRSTLEAEYIALATASAEAIWLQGLLKKLGWKNVSPIPIFSDNEGGIRLAKHDSVTNLTKHIDVQYRFIHQTIKQGKISVQHMAGTDLPADGLTKPLPKDAFSQFVHHLRMKLK